MDPTKDDPPPLAAGPVRRALFRGAFFGLLFAAGCLVVIGASGRLRPGELVMFPVLAFVSGIAIAATTLVELVASQRRPSWRRDACAAGAAFAAAFVAIVLGTLQFWYTLGVIQGGSLATGVSTLRQAAGGLLPDSFIVSALVASLSAPFAPLVVARLRGLGLAWQVPATVFGGGLLALPALVALDRRSVNMDAVLGILAVGSVALPLAARLADAAERRVARRLERD